ncbi:MAG: hypothetical protein CVU61_06565 [Deltaproteobacteria bacterium HGW-Deltaproteobacteria-19]|jgi:hypothetical protein|nr:MAG: hypothetical protein CVU61_06565 [Deltaproteobacteria bacterium HGW-Deltaproteobacteria-19]
MKNIGAKRCLSLFVCLFSWLFFLSTTWGACSGGERIGYETQKMQAEASQTLTVVGARPPADDPSPGQGRQDPRHRQLCP